MLRRLVFSLSVVLALCPAPAVWSGSDLRLDIHTHAESYRRLSAQNPLTALRLYSTPDLNLHMAELWSALWPYADPAQGWADFMRHALVITLPPTEGKGLVVYYHPWSDVGALLYWDAEGQLLDALAVPGYVLRNDPPEESHWTNADADAALAFGLSTVLTFYSLDYYMGPGSDDGFDLPDGEAEAAARMQAALQLAGQRSSLLPVYYPGPDSLSAELLNDWHALRRDIHSDNIWQDGNGAEALAQMAPERILRFTPVQYLEAEDGAVLLLANVDTPDLFVAIRSSGRVDLFSFQSFMDRLDDLLEDN